MKSKIWWIVGILVFVGIIIGSVSWYEWYEHTPGQYDSFAECLASSGVTFYGAFWCPHCQAQKAMFGKSVDKLPYVECSTPDGSGQTQECINKNIQGYPTWVDKNGSSTEGVLSFQQLSAMSGCALPQ